MTTNLSIQGTDSLRPRDIAASSRDERSNNELSKTMAPEEMLRQFLQSMITALDAMKQKGALDPTDSNRAPMFGSSGPSGTIPLHSLMSDLGVNPSPSPIAFNGKNYTPKDIFNGFRQGKAG